MSAGSFTRNLHVLEKGPKDSIYLPNLGRWTQPDSIVASPGRPSSLNRFSYSLNSPITFSDPTGHVACYGVDGYGHSTCDYPLLDGIWSSEEVESGDNLYSGKHFSRSANSPVDDDVDDEEESCQPSLDMEEKSGCYSSDESAVQGVTIILNWFLETGDETQFFGPWESITLDIIHSNGIAEFMEAWAAAGYPSPFHWQHELDVREGSTWDRLSASIPIFIKSHIIDVPSAIIGLGSSSDPAESLDLINGVIGSLDSVDAIDMGNGSTLIVVTNVTGWASGSRIPGTNSSIFGNRARSQAGPGGNLTQYYYWVIPSPISGGN